MSNIDRANQSDSPSLSIGEFHTGTGRARQAADQRMQPIVYTIAQYYPTPRAPRTKYVLENQSTRIRGTPEYNPLYEAFQSNIQTPSRQPQSDFRPITPTQPPSRFIDNLTSDFESTYDKPRSYHFDNEHFQQQQQQLPCRSPKKDSTPNSENDLLMDKTVDEVCNNEDIENAHERKHRRRRRILYNLFDFLAIVATCVIFGLIYVFIPPVQRGFFCDDTSIQYPFRPDTIPMWLLAIYGGAVPIIIFCLVELWVVRPFSCGRNANSARQRLIDYLKVIFHTIFLFILGIAVCFLITEVGKRTIGRLRPYYLSVCNPDWAKINCTRTVSTASGNVVIPQYILNHNCNTTATYVELREAQLSFPSGHSSYSTYAFIFLFVYFEARLVCPNIQFLKPFLQCLCVATAFFTCLSRVTDFKHHATDVIGGALIGFCIAVFSAVRVGQYLWQFSVYCETDEETKKDRLPKEERIKIPGVETKQSGALRSQQEPLELSAQDQNGNRSNYDNVASIQPQQRVASNFPRTIASGQRYEEANV